MKLACLPDGSPEIFYSIQGEGRNTGMPSVFIRASLCNLHCHWCDTDYTWNWEDTDFSHEKDADPKYKKFIREEEILDLPVSVIAGIVAQFPAKNFIFTGGEPLLQEKNWIELMKLITKKHESETQAKSTHLPDTGLMDELRQVQKELKVLLAKPSESPHFEVETNGTLMPSNDFIEKIHQINVSPKLGNSKVAETARLKPEVLRKLAESTKADFKFVVEESDLIEVIAIVQQCRIPTGRVFLMPKARSAEELNANQTRIAASAQKHGFRYSDRLHLRLFGAARGT